MFALGEENEILNFVEPKTEMVKMDSEQLVNKLNEALGWELRAVNMYAHYAANVKGINRIQLAPLFKQEVSESMIHADTVRNAIVKLDGICITDRNSTTIVHSNDYRQMLEESFKTESTAARVYSELLPLLKQAGDGELYDTVEQIYLTELRSIEEMRLLLN